MEEKVRKWELRWFIAKWQMPLFIGLLLYGFFRGLFIESVVFIFVSTFIRYAFVKPYHHPSCFYGCLKVTALAGLVMIPLMLPFYVSLFSMVVVSFGVGWYQWQFAERNDRLAHLESNQCTSIEIKEQEFRDKCKRLKKSRLVTERGIKRFIHEMEYSDILSTEDGLTYDTLRKSMERLEQELNNMY